MSISISQVIVGVIAGYLVGSLVTFKKEGLGWYTNIGLGLAGAIVGGAMFRLFKFDLGLKEVSIQCRRYRQCHDWCIACIRWLWHLEILSEKEMNVT